MKLRIKSMIWNIRKQKNPKSEQEEKTIWKNEVSISSLWDYIKTSNIHIIGVPEGKEKEQEFGNLFEKIMKENFPNLVKDCLLYTSDAADDYLEV